MKMINLLILVGLFSVLTPVEARGWHRSHLLEDRIHTRLENQYLRIEEALHCGRLHPRQARKLFRKHSKIARLESHFASDGWLSPKEVRILDRKLNRLDNKITAKLHRRLRNYPADFTPRPRFYYPPGRQKPAYQPPVNYRYTQPPVSQFRLGSINGQIYFGW